MKLNAAIFALVALAGAGAASAQDMRRADPADAGAAVPAFLYESAFAGYRAAVEGRAIPWREANDEVGRLGGHVGHVPGSLLPRQAMTPSRPAAAASTPPGQAAHGGRK